MGIGFGFGRRDAHDRLRQAAVVEPVHPFEHGLFHRFEAAPRSAAVEDLGLEQPVDRLGQRLVAASPTLPTAGSMPASASRSLWRRLGYREAAMPMMNQPHAPDPMVLFRDPQDPGAPRVVTARPV